MAQFRPSDIRFSQDSINNYFDARCNHSHKMIGETLDDICDNRCSVHEIPILRVALHNGHWVTADNRRLWVFRQLERLGKCDQIQVQIINYILEAKLTSLNDGKSVRVRGDPGGVWHRKPNKIAGRPKSSVSHIPLEQEPSQSVYKSTPNTSPTMKRTLYNSSTHVTSSAPETYVSLPDDNRATSNAWSATRQTTFRPSPTYNHGLRVHQDRGFREGTVSSHPRGISPSSRPYRTAEYNKEHGRNLDTGCCVIL